MNIYPPAPWKIFAITTLHMAVCHIAIACHECAAPKLIDAATGNAKRLVHDIPRIEGHAHVLSWTRYHNSVPRATTSPIFGHGGSWRHSWQYELLFEKPDAVAFTYPNGVVRVFTKTEDNQWRTESAFDDRMTMNGDTVRITTPKGETLTFKQGIKRHYGKLYLLHTYEEPRHGGIIAFHYNEEGLLTQINDQEGNRMNLEYIAVPHNAKAKGWIEFGSPVRDATTGEYNLSLGEELQSIDFTQVRVVDMNGLPIPKTSIRCHSADGTMHVQNRISNHTHVLKLPGPTTVKTVSIACAPEHEVALSGATIEGSWTQSAKTSLALAGVTASDGRSVEYIYQPMDEKSRHIVLAEAHYSDGTNAAYAYGYAQTGRPPLLKSCDDPRYPYAHKQIQYDYYPNREPGTIRRKTDPITQMTLLTLQFDEERPNVRTILYDENKTVSYTIHEEVNRAVSKTDALGRTTLYEYAENGTGKIKSKQVVGGATATYIRNERNQLVATQLNDDTSSPENNRTGTQMTKTPAATHQPKPIIAGATDRVTRNERGQITSVTDAAGRTRTFAYDKYGNRNVEEDGFRQVIYDYDSIGRVIKKVDRRGTIIYSYGTTPDGGHSSPFGMHPTKITYPDGRQDEMIYDAEARLLKKIQAANTLDSKTTTYAYDSDDRLIAVTLPDGTVKRYAYEDGKRITLQ